MFRNARFTAEGRVRLLAATTLPCLLAGASTRQAHDLDERGRAPSKADALAPALDVVQPARKSAEYRAAALQADWQAPERAVAERTRNGRGSFTRHTMPSLGGRRGMTPRVEVAPSRSDGAAEPLADTFAARVSQATPAIRHLTHAATVTGHDECAGITRSVAGARRAIATGNVGLSARTGSQAVSGPETAASTGQLSGGASQNDDPRVQAGRSLEA